MTIRALVAVLAAASVGCVTASHAASTSVPACPGHAPKFDSVDLDVAGAFVRPGATAMRLCRYYGINRADPKGLRQQRLIHGRLTVRHITRAFNKLKPAPRGIFCVRDDGTEMLVVFTYPHARAGRVVVKLTGCPFASNGGRTTQVRWATPRLLHRLLHLVKGSR
jgi:hypothetical protein